MRPMLERAVDRGRATQVGGQLLVDVDQGRWRGHTAADRKAEPVGLTWAVVGILAQDHRLHRRVRCHVQGGKNLRIRWIHGVSLSFRFDECHQL